MKIGLVIEGGGFRGVFCEGITSFLLDNDIEIPYVIGVSMGAINATNYLSKQSRRNIEIIEQFLGDSRYMSKRNLIRSGSLFGMDFIFMSRYTQFLDYKEYFKDKPHKEIRDLTDLI